MEKIKLFLESEKGKDLLVVIIVILVGLGSFELGRLSKENTQGSLKIDYGDQNTTTDTNLAPSDNSTPTTAVSSGKNFFASSRGTKYYTISCSAGKTIKQENRVWFKTGEEAKAAGYELSSSCN